MSNKLTKIAITGCALFGLALIPITKHFREKQATESSIIVWHTNLDQGLEAAKTANKPVFIDFYATWCPPCKKMDSTTFQDYGVASLLDKFESIKIDVDQHPEITKTFGVQAMPTYILISTTGERETVVGYRDADAFSELLKKYQ